MPPVQPTERRTGPSPDNGPRRSETARSSRSRRSARRAAGRGRAGSAWRRRPPPTSPRPAAGPCRNRKASRDPRMPRGIRCDAGDARRLRASRAASREPRRRTAVQPVPARPAAPVARLRDGPSMRKGRRRRAKLRSAPGCYPTRTRRRGPARTRARWPAQVRRARPYSPSCLPDTEGSRRPERSSPNPKACRRGEPASQASAKPAAATAR